MRTSGWVGAVLISIGLVVLVVQNTAPSLPLVILGARTPVLPLAVWLVVAMGLGALTAGLLVAGGDVVKGNPPRGSRRRWQVRPEPAPSRPASQRGSTTRGSTTRGSTDRGRRPPAQPPRPMDVDEQPLNRAGAQPYEDWEDWGQRSPASQWQDWDAVTQRPPETRRAPQRQQHAQAQANETFEDIATGWDERAASTTYRPAGASPVDEALDEIAEGWEDWEDEEAEQRDNAPESRPIYEVRRSPESVAKSGTNYSYRYRSADEFRSRPEATQADPGAEPVDAAIAEEAEADTSPLDALDAPEVGPDGVYDADYRVIIPPSRPLEADPD